MRPLPLRRAARPGDLHCRFKRAAGTRHHRTLAEQHHETAAQTVRHRAIRIGRARCLQLVAGVAAEAEIGANRLVKPGNRFRGRGSHLVALRIIEPYYRMSLLQRMAPTRRCRNC
jgi:hypothetical protein